MKTTLVSLVLATLHLNLFAGSPAAEDFVAHEWGTFTSVQGADGVPLEWNPLVTSELPQFVYDPSKPSGEPRRHISLYGAKSAFRSLQRMETPVIYFYSSRERSVDVTVKFPQGFITEWFPQARDIGPSWVEPRLKRKISDITSDNATAPNTTIGNALCTPRLLLIAPRRATLYMLTD